VQATNSCWSGIGVRSAGMKRHESRPTGPTLKLQWSSGGWQSSEAASVLRYRSSGSVVKRHQNGAELCWSSAGRGELGVTV